MKLRALRKKLRKAWKESLAKERGAWEARQRLFTCHADDVIEADAAEKNAVKESQKAFEKAEQALEALLQFETT